MAPRNDKGGIGWLRDRLYSRNSVPKPRERRKLRPDFHQVTESWKAIDQEEEQEPVPPKPIYPVAKKSTFSKTLTWILGASFIFFAVSLGYSAFLFISGSKVVSNANIDIEINGPVAVPGGEALALQIGVVNRNGVPLELVDLIVDYPDGTRSATNGEIELPRLRESLGEVAPGERKKTTARAVLYGEEESQQNIIVTLEYRIEGSNAILFKEKQYNVLLSSAPVALQIDSVKEITSGQEVVFDVRAVSNSVGVLEDVLVVSEYPFGFEFIESDPEPAAGNTVWNLGDLQPGEEKKITIRGFMIGQDSEDRIFRFDTGVQDKSSPSEIAASFNKKEVPITIRKPFIQLALALDGNTNEQDHVIGRGSQVRGDVAWVNNLDTTIFDGVIEVQLSGPALDQRSVDALQGFYRSSDNTLIWSNEHVSDFEEIEPGDRGSVRFEFSPLPVSPEIRLQNPEIFVEVSVKGKRLDQNDVPENIESSVSRNIRIASDVFFTSALTYTTGPFENTGPLPPKVDSETTYTMTWTMANTANDLTNVQVTSKLPSYVTWVGLTNPQTEDIKYNPNTRDIVWTVGDVQSGLGYTSQSKQVSFKIGFTPSLGQVGETPVLVNEQFVRGFDLFTNTLLESKRGVITTQLRNDPGAPGGSSRVIE